MSELDDRKQQVLKAVVDDYTETAVPVGSQVLAARYFERWSSATIRNELAHLMESGHLQQPHTSSGRVPSDRGYRYFVDFLMREEAVEPDLQSHVETFFLALPPDLEAILEGTAMMLSQVAQNVGVVTAPRTSECRLKYVDLVHLEANRILALVVLEGNLVRQQPLELPAEVTQDALGRLSSRINQEAQGKSHAEMTGYLESALLEPWERAAAAGVAEFMASFDAQSATVIIHDGVRNLVRQPEFFDAERLLPVLELLEESRGLARLLEAADAREQFEILIGDENPDSHLRGCSMVITTYGGERLRGTLGAIGPTRMRYSQVVARMRVIAQLAGDAITRISN